MQEKSFSENDNHGMRHVGTRSSYHEFLCDKCGRHLLLHVDPSDVEDGEKMYVILNEGDAMTPHSGGIGGLNMTGFSVDQNDGDEQEPDWDEVKASLDDVVDEILNGDDE